MLTLAFASLVIRLAGVWVTTSNGVWRGLVRLADPTAFPAAVGGVAAPIAPYLPRRPLPHARRHDVLDAFHRGPGVLWGAALGSGAVALALLCAGDRRVLESDARRLDRWPSGGQAEHARRRPALPRRQHAPSVCRLPVGHLPDALRRHPPRRRGGGQAC